MSVRVSTWVWHETGASGSDLLVLLALADSANDDGQCWPGVDVLVEKTRMSRATVFRRLDALESAGLIERLRRGKRQTNVYRVVVPWADGVTSQIETGVKSQPETHVKSQIETGEVSPVRPVKSHGRDFQGTVSEPSLKRQGARECATRIPDDFDVTPAMRQWATSKGFGHLPLDAITEDFFDYWRAKAGPAAVKVDWQRTWQRWIRQEAAKAPRSTARSAWDRAIEVGSPEWRRRQGASS